MALITRLHAARTEMLGDQDDPWRRLIERALPSNLVSISTVGIFSLLDLPMNTASCRRVGRIMRQLGWIGIRSRRLEPGSWRTTECRGWSRTVRSTKSSPTTTNAGAIAPQLGG